jgi:hypothetical protein
MAHGVTRVSVNEPDIVWSCDHIAGTCARGRALPIVVREMSPPGSGITEERQTEGKSTNSQFVKEIETDTNT